jgi:hypothetical protein
MGQAAPVAVYVFVCDEGVSLAAAYDQGRAVNARQLVPEEQFFGVMLDAPHNRGVDVRAMCQPLLKPVRADTGVTGRVLTQNEPGQSLRLTIHPLFPLPLYSRHNR